MPAAQYAFRSEERLEGSEGVSKDEIRVRWEIQAIFRIQKWLTKAISCVSAFQRMRLVYLGEESGQRVDIVPVESNKTGQCVHYVA